MKKISAGYEAVLDALHVLAGVVILSIFVLIVADVFMRVVGIPPWTYISALVEYGLLWFTMLAAPWLARTKGHVFIDAITLLLPPRAQRFMAKIAYAVCICTTLVFSLYSFDLLIEAIRMGHIDTRGEDMPLWTLLLPMPFCFLMLSIEFGRYLIGIDTMYGGRTDAKDSV